MVVKFIRHEPLYGGKISPVRKFVVLALSVIAILIFINRDQFPLYTTSIECPNDSPDAEREEIAKISTLIAVATDSLEELEAKLQKIRTENEELIITNKNLSMESQGIRKSISLIKRGVFEPTVTYEKRRRRVQANIDHMWDYIDYKMSVLIPECKNDSNLQDVHLTLYEMTSSLLADVSEMTKNDGFEKWRQRELADLEDLVQKRLINLQNPEHCDDVKKLLCHVNNFDCGFGCQIHHVAECLAIAYGHRRTMVYDSHGFDWDVKGYDKIFKPLSATCVYNEKFNQSVPYPGSEDDKILELQHTMELPHMGIKFLFPAIPEDLAPRLEKMFYDPSAWWQGQMKKYFMKLLPQLEAIVMNTKKKINFHGPIAGIHVRRTDKLDGESSFISVEDYMEEVEAFFDRESLFNKIEKRRVFVASEDPDVIDVVRNKYPDYEVISNRQAAEEAEDKSKRYTFEGIMGIFTDMYLLAKCDYVVCTFSSNVCRSIYEMMYTERHDAYSRVKSLDIQHVNFWQRPIQGVVVMDHVVTPSAGDIELKIGDVVEVTGRFNAHGQFHVTNLRTNQTGYIPAFKVDPLVETANFPTYENVL